jgi:hypothetical protein
MAALGVLVGAVLAGCAGGARTGELERRGYRNDQWYQDRHEGVVEAVFIRDRRVSYWEREALRRHEAFREIWLQQQRRRISSRQRARTAKIQRRRAFLTEQTGTLGVLEERRREEAATRTRLLEKFQQVQGASASGVEQRSREDAAERARRLQRFQESNQPPPR